ETSRIIRAACFAAPVRNYATDGDEPPMPRVPHLYYCDPIELKDALGVAVAPQFVVDVASAMAMKESMLACHASQREWLRAPHGADEYVEVMKRWTRARGESVGVQFGEGFRQHLGHAYPATPLMQESLARFVRASPGPTDAGPVAKEAGPGKQS